MTGTPVAPSLFSAEWVVRMGPVPHACWAPIEDKKTTCFTSLDFTASAIAFVTFYAAGQRISNRSRRYCFSRLTAPCGDRCAKEGRCRTGSSRAPGHVGTEGRGGRRSGRDAELVERVIKLRGVTVHSVGARLDQLVLPVPAGEQTDAEHARAARGEQIPDGVADDAAVFDRHAEPLLTGEEEIRRRLRAAHLAAIDHEHMGREIERHERAVDLRMPAGRGDPVRHTQLAEVTEQRHRPGEWASLRQDLPENIAVALLEEARLFDSERAPDLTRHRPREEPAAHPDAPMNPPAVDRHTRLGERELP